MQRSSHVILLLLLFGCFHAITASGPCLAQGLENSLQLEEKVGESKVNKLPCPSAAAFPSSHLLTERLQADFTRRLNRLIDVNDAAMLTSPNGTPLLAAHCQKSLIPASIHKILTALIALHHLGSDYRFATDFYMDGDQNLKVKGHGDPLLVSESLTQIAQRLARHASDVKNIIIDDSFFQNSTVIPGKNQSLEPYDAPNGALCINFNTVAFKQVNGTFLSDEEQTPLLPFALKKARSSGLKQGRIMLAGNTDESIQYAGEMLIFFLNRAGVNVTGKIHRGNVDLRNDELILHYLSDCTLDQVIARLMEFSNNFIANQLFLTLGAEVLGEPATLEKAVALANDFIKKNVASEEIVVVEGSGLARANRISAAAMIVVLNHFEPYYHLLRRGDKEYYKTGTLNNVKSRAGYLEDAAGRRYPYAVLINTPSKTTDAIMKIFRQAVSARMH